MNHNSSAPFVKENFSTVLQLISPEIHQAALPMEMTSSCLYSSITTPVERDARCPGNMGQLCRFRTSPAVALWVSSGVLVLMLGRYGYGQSTTPPSQMLSSFSRQLFSWGNRAGTRASARTNGTRALDTDKSKVFSLLVLYC